MQVDSSRTLFFRADVSEASRTTKHWKDRGERIVVKRCGVEGDVQNWSGVDDSVHCVVVIVSYKHCIRTLLRRLYHIVVVHLSALVD